MKEKTKTALVVYVDDEPGNRLVFQETFGDLFDIRAVDSGRLALEMLEHEEVAVLVTDQRMPGMSGNELLKKVKEQYPQIVRVVVTAYADLDPILKAVNEGLVARYVLKPWRQAEMRDLLLWALDAYRLGSVSAEAQLRLLQVERLATIGTLHSALVHDLNQPLSYLLTNVERLGQHAVACPDIKKLVRVAGDSLSAVSRGNVASLADELPAIHADLATGATHIKALISCGREILGATGDQCNSALQPVPTIRFALAVCSTPAMSARCRVVFNAPSEPPMVRFGSTQLAQVLINLLCNAIEAVGRKTSGERLVTVGLMDSGAFATLTVADNGPGMSPEVLKMAGTQLFTTRKDGIGLGLSQCRRLIEGVGGEMRIHSQMGQGTTVSVSLKKADDDSVS